MEHERAILTRPGSTRAAAVLGGSLALGIALAGYLASEALFAARASERFVTVKGLAERTEPADLALWPIAFTVTDDDLEGLQGKVDQAQERIREFLVSEGFDPGDAATSMPQISDRESMRSQSRGSPIDRYQAQGAIVLRSGDVAGVQAAMTRTGKLVADGIALVRSYDMRTQFLFTRLEEIKPEMIAEATRDARRAAEQFAEDSGSRVGAIRRARQGYFSIEDLDAFSPEVKSIRVVTTIEFFLLDP